MKSRKEILKDKMWMKTAQSNAKKLMSLEGKIWDKHGWKSGGDVNKIIHKKELKKILGKKKFKPVVAEILEDANYHSMNQALQDMDYVEYKGDRLKKYFKLGGKTWDIK